jgi:uncharacterized protein YhhL (DUF1145 family)
LPYLYPLNIFLAVFGGILVIIFLSTGIYLLRTLKKYSDQIYKNSRCKIVFTIVMWSCGILIQVVAYVLQAVAKNESVWDEYKYKSLVNDDIRYSLLLFGNLLTTEYVPLISLLISLVISYRNNVAGEKMVCEQYDNEEQVCFDGQEFQRIDSLERGTMNTKPYKAA